MSEHPTILKFVSSNRRVREDRRFVVGGGLYVADIVLDEMLHVALVPSAVSGSAASCRSMRWKH